MIYNFFLIKKYKNQAFKIIPSFYVVLFIWDGSFSGSLHFSNEPEFSLYLISASVFFSSWFLLSPLIYLPT